MIKNKKDFVVRAILFQSLFCILLFGLLFFLKQSNSELFKAIESIYENNDEESMNDYAELLFTSFYH